MEIECGIEKIFKEICEMFPRKRELEAYVRGCLKGNYTETPKPKEEEKKKEATNVNSNNNDGMSEESDSESDESESWL